MDIVDTILRRRSVRSGFDARPVPLELLQTIAACGLAAPSSKGARPWRFHMLQDREQLAFIAAAASSAQGLDEWVPHDPRTGRPDPRWTSSVLESVEVLADAPCAILLENRGVFSHGRKALASTPADRLEPALDGYAFECMGMGAALENIWLAAIALGLQAAFLGDMVIAEAAISERFGLSGDLLGVICLGYADAAQSAPRTAEASDSLVVWH